MANLLNITERFRRSRVAEYANNIYTNQNNKSVTEVIRHHFEKNGKIDWLRVLDADLENSNFGYALVQMKTGQYAQVGIYHDNGTIQIFPSPLHSQDINESNNKRMPKPKILNELNDDCIKEILERLPLEDLGTVADVCSQFKEMAKQIAATRLSKFEPIVFDFSDFTKEMYNVNGGQQWIKRLFRLELFFRYFGKEIRSIIIRFPEYQPIGKRDLYYYRRQFYKATALTTLLTYCRDFRSELTHLTIEHMDITPICSLLSIMGRLTYLDLNGSHVPDQLLYFKRLYHLRLRCYSSFYKYFWYHSWEHFKYFKLHTLEISVSNEFFVNKRHIRFELFNKQIDPIAVKALIIHATGYNCREFIDIGSSVLCHLEEIKMNIFDNCDEQTNATEYQHNFEKLKRLKRVSLHGNSEMEIELLIQCFAKAHLPIKWMKISGCGVNRNAIDSILALSQLKEIELDKNLKNSFNHLKKLRNQVISWV